MPVLTVPLCLCVPIYFSHRGTEARFYLVDIETIRSNWIIVYYKALYLTGLNSVR